MIPSGQNELIINGIHYSLKPDNVLPSDTKIALAEDKPIVFSISALRVKEFVFRPFC